MELKLWIKDQGLTALTFAEKVNHSEFAVGKWVRGERIPRPDAMRKIAEVTGGGVTAADFYR